MGKSVRTVSTFAVAAFMLAAHGCAENRFAWAVRRAGAVLCCPASQLEVRAQDEDSGYNMFRVSGCGGSVLYVDDYYFRSNPNLYGKYRQVPAPQEGWHESQSEGGCSVLGARP
jgi:hypothetical protein